MRKRLLLIAALVVLGGMLHAQQMPPGKWWRRPEVIQQLELTREQQNRLDGVFQDAANGLIDAKADVEKLQVALRGELDRPALRRQEILNVAAQLNQARGRLFERELTMLVEMRGVLNEDQWNRLRGFLDRMQQRGGQRGGPGPDRPMGRQMPGRRRP